MCPTTVTVCILCALNPTSTDRHNNLLKLTTDGRLTAGLHCLCLFWLAILMAVVILFCSVLQPEGPSLEERRSLSRYGVWLLVNLCTPDRTTPDQTLARLLAALFNWFEATAYLGDGSFIAFDIGITDKRPVPRKDISHLRFFLVSFHNFFHVSYFKTRSVFLSKNNRDRRSFLSEIGLRFQFC